MSSDDQIVAVRLRRGTTSTPWGFRMQGGNEYGSTLYIQKVNPKSLSYRQGLRVGDRLVAIADRQTHHMTHEVAKMEIIRAGNELDILVQRSGGVQPAVDQYDAKSPVRVHAPTRAPAQAPKHAHPSEESTEYRGYTNPNVQSRSFKILQESLSYSEADEEGIVLPSGHTPGEAMVLRAYGEGKRRMEELMELNPRNFTAEGESPYRFASPHIREEDETRLKQSGSRRRRPDSTAADPAVAKTYGSVSDAPRKAHEPQAVDLAHSSVFAPAAAQQQYIQQAQENYHQRPQTKPLMMVNQNFDAQYGHMRREPGIVSPVNPPQHLEVHPQQVQSQAQPQQQQQKTRRRQRANPPAHHMPEAEKEAIHHVQAPAVQVATQKAISPSVSTPKSPSFIPTTNTVSSVAADLDLKHEDVEQLTPIAVAEPTPKPAETVAAPPEKEASSAVNIVAEQVVNAAISEAKTDVVQGTVQETPAPAPVKEAPAPAPAPTTAPEEAKPVPAKVEAKPAPAPEETKPAPVKVDAKPAPAPEEAKPAPVKEEAKPVAAPEEAKPAPAKEEAKPASAPEEAKPAPAKEEAKPAPAQEAAKPAPAQAEPKLAPKQEEPKPAPKQEEPKPAPKQEEPKPAPKQEEPKPAPKQEEPKPAPKQEEPKPATKQEEPKQAPKQEEPKPAPKQEEPKPAPKQEQPKPVPVQEQPKPAPKQEESKPAPPKEEPKSAPIKVEAQPAPVKEEPSTTVEETATVSLAAEEFTFTEQVDTTESDTVVLDIQADTSDTVVLDIQADTSDSVVLDIQADATVEDDSNVADEVTLILDAEASVDVVETNDASTASKTETTTGVTLSVSDSASLSVSDSASPSGSDTNESGSKSKRKSTPSKSAPKVFDSQGGVSARLAKFGLKK